MNIKKTYVLIKSKQQQHADRNIKSDFYPLRSWIFSCKKKLQYMME